MAAPVLSLDDYPNHSRRMKIPLQSEVAKYMREKMGWPEAFCKEYADKFWYYYQAQGWKLSNGNAMKDWKAAFCSQWQTIKDKDMQDKLAAMTKKEDVDNPVEYLNKCLEAHRRKEYKPTRDELVGIYDYLKATKRMILDKATWAKIVEDAGNSRERGKMLAVRALFDAMLVNDRRFI